MNRFRQSAAAVLLLCMMACGTARVCAHPTAFIQDFRAGYAGARPESPTFFEKLGAAFSGAEHAVDSAVSRCTPLITLYGGFQRLVGCEIVQDANAENNVVRLKNGKLNFIARDAVPGDPSENAARLDAFAADAALQGIPTLFVLAPQKICKYEDVKPAGAIEFGNENSDRFLSLLETDSLDLRPAFYQDAPGGHDACFFNTDHHWTPEGAFFAFQQIAAQLEDSYGFQISAEITDRMNYETSLYPKSFLGSQGKRVGPWYAGMDDFSLLLPIQDSQGFSFEIPHKQVVRTGSFEDAFIFSEMLQTNNNYYGNPYVAYTGGDYPLSIARNDGLTDGKTILLIRQSFSCALAPFLARACKELHIIDPRYYEGSIQDFAADLRPDLILVLYAASDTCNDALFRPLTQ